MLTVLWFGLGSNISGAIHPSVPAAPDLREKEYRPAASFLHRPKSEIITRISPFGPAMEIRTLWGLTSRCTEKKIAIDI